MPDRSMEGGESRTGSVGSFLIRTWRPLLVVVGVAGGSVGLWTWLKPGEPNLPRYEGFETQEPGYQPGGSGCDPSRLARLAIPGREAADERDRCSEAAEDYRLKANDLIQQTRSAEAAEAIVRLTYGQSLMALTGLILGGITMVAAIAAAVYARQAASETKRGANAAADAADAAAEANSLNRQTLVADQRPWIKVGVTVAGPVVWGHETCLISMSVAMENIGKTPAREVVVYTRACTSSIIGEARGKLTIENNHVANQLQLAHWCETERESGGATIFPNERTEHKLDVGLTAGIVMRNKKARERAGPTGDQLSIYVVGCVDYRNAFDASIHQTGFIFDVFREAPGKSRLFGPSDGDIPAAQVRFRPYSTGGRVC
jgi:hypothetical protein